MADKIIPSVGGDFAGTGFNAFDLFGIMVAKRATELTLMPIVGNSSWKSAAVKGVGAVLVYALSNSQQGLVRKGGQIIAAGMAFDAMEDASIALLGPNPLSFMAPAQASGVASSGISYVDV